MNTDPSLDLQKAIIAAVKAAVPPIAGGRIYDRVPPDRVFPYLTIGPCLVVSDDADCVTGYEIFQTLDVWSRAVGSPEMKGIVGQVRTLLHGAALPLDSFALNLIEHDGTRYLRDADGLTEHGAIELRALAEAVPA